MYLIVEKKKVIIILGDCVEIGRIKRVTFFVDFRALSVLEMMVVFGFLRNSWCGGSFTDRQANAAEKEETGR